MYLDIITWSTALSLFQILDYGLWFFYNRLWLFVIVVPIRLFIFAYNCLLLKELTIYFYNQDQEGSTGRFYSKYDSRKLWAFYKLGHIVNAVIN